MGIDNCSGAWYSGLMPCPSICPKRFWTVQIILLEYQIIKNSPEKSNLKPTKMIWTHPKWFGHDQNNLYQSKTIWTVQTHF